MTTTNEDFDETAPARAGGVLYLVATPIGNLEDVTARALRVLRECDVIAAEDTRVTRKLLAHFDIHTPLISYHAHTTEARADALLGRLLGGQSVALTSDAGTPCISDPGAELVAEAVRQGVRVEPIPGACAAVAAVCASGLPPQRFVFEGFLPRDKGERRARIEAIRHETRTLVFYEAPPRLVDTLGELGKMLGDGRPVTVAREITKKFEEFQRGALAEVMAYYKANPPRGECVIVLGGADANAADANAPASNAPPTEDLIADALARGLSPRDAAREIARATGMSRNDVYALVQRLRDSGGDDADDA